jgi:predicted DNA-binding transcriptional regulator YafY
MPKSTVHNAVVRQLEILNFLPNTSVGMTTADLTRKLKEAEFEVTKRSVERDLLKLEESCGVRCDDTSKPYRWYKTKTLANNLPGMDFADALSLALAEELLGKLLPVSFRKILEPKFSQARSKLAATTSNRYAKWMKRARYVSPTLPFLPPKIETRVLEAVQDAIVNEHQIQVRYSPAYRRTGDRTLNPLALVQCGPITYLVATEFDYQEPRIYALHRISWVKMTDEPAQSPKDFSLDAFIGQGGMEFGGGKVIRLKAEVSNELASYLTESRLTKDQLLKPLDGDKYVLTVTLKDSWQLTFWILSQGAEIAVVEPKELREQIQERLKAALNGYRSP